MESADLLDLDCSQRVVTWTDRPTGRVRRHVLKRIEKADLKEFYRARDDNPLGALVALYRKLAIGAGGYVVRGAELMEFENWRELIPGPDARQVIDLLLTLTPYHGADHDDIHPEFDVVRLNAIWNPPAPPASCRPGEMQWHLSLEHRFARMTTEDEAELKDQRTRGITVGGSRSGRVLKPIEELVLMSWHDRQIREVAGYAVGGQPLASVEEIRQWMDPFHKLAAVQQWLAILPDAEVTQQN